MAKLKLKKLPKKPKSKTLRSMQTFIDKKAKIEKENAHLLKLEKEFNRA